MPTRAGSFDWLACPSRQSGSDRSRNLVIKAYSVSGKMEAQLKASTLATTLSWRSKQLSCTEKISRLWHSGLYVAIRCFVIREQKQPLVLLSNFEESLIGIASSILSLTFE